MIFIKNLYINYKSFSEKIIKLYFKLLIKYNLIKKNEVICNIVYFHNLCYLMSRLALIKKVCILKKRKYLSSYNPEIRGYGSS
jgi:hypothetical protein